jgi:S-sulfo-L-cysteine synthase (O-acetyl-L-serine-dependent)
MVNDRPMAPQVPELILDSDMLAAAFSGKRPTTLDKSVEHVPSPSSARSQLLTAQIGNTPLIRLRSLEPRAGIEVYGKAEWANPGGSVKDRAALAMIEAGERSGALTKDKIIIDATSGNTGIAYAMIGAARGYKVALCVPASASPERKKILRTFGAELILTDAAEGSDGAIREVRRRYAEHPERYFYPDQYNNPENWRAHYRTTGVEIWRQTNGRITHFVSALGTSGTFVGTTRRLKQYNPKIVAISVQPDSPFHGLEGLKHMATAIVPGIYDPTLADVDATIDTEAAYAMARRIAREEGILLGISGGAALAVAERTARESAPGRDAVLVTILPDSGSRYLSDRFWDEMDEA